jgi:hypothetical protein
MSQLYQTKIWQVSLPDGWKVRELQNESASLFKPDGVGHITVMVAPPHSKLPASPPGVPFSGKIKGYASGKARLVGRVFLRFWWLSCRGETLTVSYSCASTYAKTEQDEVDEIVQSIAESDSSSN